MLPSWWSIAQIILSGLSPTVTCWRAGLARIGITAFERAVSEAMESPVPSCLPDDTVNQILRVMTEKRVRHVVVMHDRKMAGIVSIGDW